MGQPDEMIRSRPDWAMMPDGVRNLYLKARDHYWANPPTEARRHRWIAVHNQLVQAISDSGGRIMAGSDTPEWFLGYGFTLHRELESLVAAGLAPRQALAAATRTLADFLHALREWVRSSRGSARTWYCSPPTRWKTFATLLGSKACGSAGAGWSRPLCAGWS
jgi:hypothetical protein